MCLMGGRAREDRGSVLNDYIARPRLISAPQVEGDAVQDHYDPMLGKLIAWGENREQARLRLLAMLDEFAIGGLKTNIAFLRRILAHPAFAAAGSSGRDGRQHNRKCGG